MVGLDVCPVRRVVCGIEEKRGRLIFNSPTTGTDHDNMIDISNSARFFSGHIVNQILQITGVSHIS